MTIDLAIVQVRETGLKCDDAEMAYCRACIEAQRLLREFRQSRGVSLRALARVYRWSATYLSDIERGNRLVDSKTLARLRDLIIQLSPNARR